jgi:hypothetical protein
MNDDFRLNSVYFDNETDPELVWQVGYELVSLFNGVSNIISTNHRKMELAELQHNGVLVRKIAKQNVMALLGRPNLTPYVIDLELKKAIQLDVRFLMLNLATEREDIYLILKYFDMELSWINLYKTLETIESLSKKTKINLSINKKKRGLFTNTANNFSLSGLESRHGFKQVIKENKTPSMEVDEAHQFVSEIAKEYLNKVASLITQGLDTKSCKVL